ncbi:YaaC family protein [Lentibacillus salinarum]|uniref:YaaC family protein n=1 Tax=Lentibacillus salinarum TaxID=446820 RepID=A0ABW3ZW57_9BACI
METKQLTDFYTYLQSQQTAQHYLYGCYQQMSDMDAAVKSFENSHAFMQYLDHGIRFFENGQKLETLLQPVLFFYGMVHLLKAALLTSRPHYPESTAILAHGVSTRKRKKRDYTFMDDEMKIQHNGLYPYFSEHLFAIKESPFSKIKMERLLSLIPEMTALFGFHNNERMIAVGEPGTALFNFPASLLDSYHLTGNAFIKRIKPYLPRIRHIETGASMIQVELAQPFQPEENSPFFTDRERGALYFPVRREDYLPVSEIMVHYLLLYNLSMLCRYEPEWWGDLLAAKPEQDFPFIKTFLKTTSEKVPLMIGELLMQKHVSY